MRTSDVVFLSVGTILFLAALFTDLCNVASRREFSPARGWTPGSAGAAGDRRTHAVELVDDAMRTLMEELTALGDELRETRDSLGSVGWVAEVVLVRGLRAAFVVLRAAMCSLPRMRRILDRASSYSVSRTASVVASDIVLLMTTLADGLRAFNAVNGHVTSIGGPLDDSLSGAMVQLILATLGQAVNTFEAQVPIPLLVAGNAVVMLRFWRRILTVLIETALLGDIAIGLAGCASVGVALMNSASSVQGNPNPLPPLTLSTAGLLTVAWSALLFTRLRRTLAWLRDRPSPISRVSLT